MKTYVCYLLKSRGSAGLTYIGVTNDFPRRLRQHNGEIKGGARYTTKHPVGWEPMLIIGGFESRSDALKFEWAAKRAENRSTVISGMRARANRMCDLITPSLRVLECDCVHFLTGKNVRLVWDQKEKSSQEIRADEG